jgi:hypothetical protein
MPLTLPAGRQPTARDGIIKMSIYQMLDDGAFDPVAVQVLTSAFEEACAVLRLVDRTDPLTEIVAKKIIEHARRGERDPVRLRDIVLSELQQGNR